MSQQLKDSIWLTSRVRMGSERRLRLWNRIWTSLTIWYSISLTCLTIYQLVSDKNQNRDVIATTLSVALLALSIYIPSFNLEAKSEKFRECYLKLQRLLNEQISSSRMAVAYMDILESYPNHSNGDYIDLVVQSKMANQPICNEKGPIEPTCYMTISYLIRRLSLTIFVVGSVIAPFFIYYIM